MTDDLIYRGKLIQRFCGHCVDGGKCTEKCFDVKIIESIPPVDAVPVRPGEWEMKPDPFGFFHDIPVCSRCGCTTKMREKTKYCPNCGARMKSPNPYEVAK